MEFTEDFLRALVNEKVTGNFPPFETGKFRNVENYIVKLVGHLSENKKIVLKADYDNYGSGFASYVNVKVSKRDRSDTQIFKNGNKTTEWTKGLELYICKLAPYWFFGSSEWSKTSENEIWAGGSSGFLRPESFGQVDHNFWHSEIEYLRNTFESFWYRLLVAEELSRKLWFDINIPTILANEAYEVFDCFFYWTD